MQYQLYVHRTFKHVVSISYNHIEHAMRIPVISRNRIKIHWTYNSIQSNTTTYIENTMNYNTYKVCDLEGSRPRSPGQWVCLIVFIVCYYMFNACYCILLHVIVCSMYVNNVVQSRLHFHRMFKHFAPLSYTHIEHTIKIQVILRNSIKIHWTYNKTQYTTTTYVEHTITHNKYNSLESLAGLLSIGVIKVTHIGIWE